MIGNMKGAEGRRVPRSPMHHCHRREIAESSMLSRAANRGSSFSRRSPWLSHRVGAMVNVAPMRGTHVAPMRATMVQW